MRQSPTLGIVRRPVMNLTPEQIRNIIVYVLTLIISVAVHEWGHAYMADRLGDNTPRREGRVTLNPLAHADPIGTFLLPLITAVYAASSGGMIGGFGWGKPVMTQPNNYTRKYSMSTGLALVSIAGPLMNIVLALVIATVHGVLLWQNVLAPDSKIHLGLIQAVYMNFTLFFFNMLPIPPMLDGSKVLARFVPYRHRSKLDNVAVYGFAILAAFMLIPQLQQVFLVPARFCGDHVYDLILRLVR